MGYIVYTDPSKQAIEIRFSHKYNNENYSSLMFNDTDLQLATILKHLGLFLDSKLDPIGIMKRISSNPSRKSLLKIYKFFIRPNLDYADIFYKKF